MEQCELHLHTEYSRDCATSLRTVIASCTQRGITTLFVTDHNEIEGAKRLQALAPFRVIVSEEITTSEGEIIGYFLKERIAPYQSPEETIRKIREQGGLVSVPHPFDRLRHSAIRQKTLERIIDRVDLLEVFNARNVFARDDQKAEQYARGRHKPRIAVSDAHSRWETSRSRVIVPFFESPQEFLSSLQQAQLLKRRSPIFVHALTKWNKFRFSLGLKKAPDAQ